MGKDKEADRAREKPPERQQTLEIRTFDDDCGVTMKGEEEEAPPGFEPGMADLQSTALPLG